MASATSTTMDSLVAIKVNFENVTRKLKIPLRDTAPLSFEPRIRAFLQIPLDLPITLERYSDSAGTYMLLAPTNVAVYKQLYRAAKSKMKLKLRVTRKDQEHPVIPRAVTVEDVPEDNAPPAEPESKNEKAPQWQYMSQASMANNTFGELAAFHGPQPIPDVTKDSTFEASSSHHHPKSSGCPEDLEMSEVDAIRSADVLASYIKTHIAGSQCARFAICCNNCEMTTPGVHYHCATCEDGDFDLCEACIDKGITCHDKSHWLIKRTTEDGQIVSSTTETIPFKLKAKDNIEPPVPSVEAKSALARLEATMSKLNISMRTCNCCVEERPESDFLHCQICADFDLCQPCFDGNAHGHHPSHGFEPAVAGAVMPDHITVKMAPGRNQEHHAICDNCDKFITGVRHKCLDCPDWDYCAECMPLASVKHPKHRFVPLYEPLLVTYASHCPAAQPVHSGICCDGPLCALAKAAYPRYIRGTRYKCAVCDDVDFCAGCEASPENKHNKTHPMIKFKTPVRHASVTTHAAHEDGKPMPPMGDRRIIPAPSMNAVQTVVDMKPQEPTILVSAAPTDKEMMNTTPIPISDTVSRALNNNDPRAVFLHDSVADGTILAPNHVFQQTWVLRNEGNVPWPAKCFVKYVGGDYMGFPDPNRPAGIVDLISASESTVCDKPLGPGEEFAFTVWLRTPARAGKIVSYWRLTTQDGFKFGHRLWCDVNVRALSPEVPSKPDTPVVEAKKEAEEAELKSSQMIFPTLEKESPASSIHEEAQASEGSTGQEEENLVSSDGFEACGDEDWDDSVNGFMTDEEYDILDASDEEYLEEQVKEQQK